MAEDWAGINTDRDLELLQRTSSAQIYVGTENQCWILPLDLLCHVSKFFKAAFRGGFQEEKEKLVTLREEDPSMFKHFVLWLYKGQMLESQKAEPVDIVTVKAWIMGDKLGAPGFQNYIMKELVTDDWSKIY